MDQQVQKLKNASPQKIILILKEKNKSQIIEYLGYSNYNSAFDIWAYDLIRNLFFRREMILFFAEDQVNDILITDYLLGNKIRDYIY